MKISIYLHSYITDVIKTFGTIEEVVNRILDVADEGLIEIEDRPACEPREGASRYDVEVTSENYLQLLQVYGIKSKRISLRRLLYWFVENEVYNDLGWEPVNDYIDKVDATINKKIDKIVSDIDNLIMFMCHSAKFTNTSILEEARENIKECRR